MKKIITFLLVLFSLFVLVGCGENNTIKPNNNNNNTNEEVVAKLDSSKQGTYYGDDVTVVISESKVAITDPSGKTLEYTIYVEGDKYYILEEGKKVYCTFGDNSVTNSHGTFTKKGGNSGGDTVAKLDSSKQGTYYGDDVTVVIYESKVTITDPSGKTLEYTIYVEGNKYYILEGGEKVYCTFGDNTVTNAHGTFTKRSGGTGEKTPANISSADQGDYYAGPVKITVYASKVVVYEGERSFEYNLYVDGDGKIYFIDEGFTIYCTIGNGKVENSYGTFTRDGGMTTVSASEAAIKFAGFLSLNTADFRIPGGSSVQDSMIQGEDADTYVVTVVNPTEDFSTYYEYFTNLFISLGYSGTDSAFAKIDSEIKGVAIDYDEKTSTLSLVASIIKDSGFEEMDASEFIRICKEKFNIELNFPESITKIQNYYYSEDYGLGSLYGSFKLDDVQMATEVTFNDLAGRLDAKLAPIGFVKGEAEIKKYANAMELKVKWEDANYNFVLLELVVEDNDYSFGIDVFSDVVGGETGDEWPASDISSFYSNQVTIPAFTGEFESVFVNKEAANASLTVTLTDVIEKDFNLYLQALIAAGFDETEVNGYTKYLENGYVVLIYAVLSQNVATYTFKLKEQVSTPWPSDKIKQHFGEEAARIIPAPNDGGKASYSATYANNMLVIKVDSNLQTDLMQNYITQLRNSSFVDGGMNSFEYTFSNNNVIEISVFSTSTAQNSFTISIELKEYVGMEYNLPENFVAKINDNGFTLIKIGESYVYRYDYGNISTKLEVFLYDSNKKQWLHAEGQIIKQAGASGITWQNYGTTAEPVYFQYVNRPQVDDFLSGTNGLAYMYYEDYLEAGTNVTKDSSKNAVIAGANCEYVTFSTSMGSYYTTTTELWIEPTTKMIYKVEYTLQMSGQTQKSTPFEIKSIDLTKTTLKDAGIGNCMLPTFDKTTATDADHTYGENIEEPATCGKDGVIYKVCSSCGEKKVISTTPATGEHHAETYDGKPIWYSDGEGHHSLKCTICHEFYDTEDCQYSDWANDTAATCTHEGQRHRTCSICRDTIYEKTPVDPNAHTYIGYYATNVVVVMPTKEAAGSITWSCREECGHTETLTLPKLEEANSILGVYNDYVTNKNYKLYGLNLAKMIEDMNKFLPDSEEMSVEDPSYITRLLFDSQEAFVYNYDYNNPLYGFLGDEIEDELASVPNKYRGDLFDDDNNKLVLGENTLTLTIEDETHSGTLYVRDNEIYFNEELDGYTYKVTVTLNEDGTVTLDYYGTFAKRVIAIIDEEALGEYFGEDEDENEIKLEVLATTIKVTTLDGTNEYVIYIKDEDYYIVTSDNEIGHIYFDGDFVSVDFYTWEVTFERKNEENGEDEGEDDNEEFPWDAVGEFLGTEEFFGLTYDGATYSFEVVEDEVTYISVRLDLPEEVDKAEVLAEFIESCEGYSEETGYYDLENGYGLSMAVHEEDNAIMLMYYSLGL